MLNYANSLFCAYNSTENNLVIKFRQEEPVDPDGPNDSVVTNEIASIVISRDLALRLAENINLLANQEVQG